MKRTLTSASAALVIACPAHAADPLPPPPAAFQGYTEVLFNTDFSRSSLLKEVSCENAPQTNPWKQGLWWEDRSRFPACRNAIREVLDPVFGTRVLDLRWTLAGDTDQQNETSVSTFPLDYVSPHFSFLHGYVELVARFAPASAGIWPVLYTWTDFMKNGSVPPTEIDVIEYNGGGAPNQPKPAFFFGNIHVFYPNGQLNETAYQQQGTLTFDPAQPHTYGMLWKPNDSIPTTGFVCSYLDNMQVGDCQGTPEETEVAPAFLIVGMGVGCGWQTWDESCLKTKRADFYIQRVTVFGPPD